MDNGIRNELDNFVSRLQYIQNNIDQYVRNKINNHNVVGDEIASRIVGGIFNEMFESSTWGNIGRKLAYSDIKRREKQEYDTFISYQTSDFQNILNQARNLLSRISIITEDLKPEGNSKTLLKKLADIESYTRLETKIEKMMATLAQIREEELIFNENIKLHIRKKKIEPSHSHYEILKELEYEFRHFIGKKLLELSSNWWEERIPKPVKNKAESRKERNENPWPWKEIAYPLLAYVDFSDYSKIILDDNNWKDIFQKIFHEKDWISVRLKELEPIRNSIAHPRPLTERENKKLQLYSDEIMDLII